MGTIVVVYDDAKYPQGMMMHLVSIMNEYLINFNVGPRIRARRLVAEPNGQRTSSSYNGRGPGAQAALI